MVYKFNVYYDVGCLSVQFGLVSELFKFCDLLFKNFSLVVEIFFYIDLNGNVVVNEEFSQCWANVIVCYLMSEGIDQACMIFVGYGEVLLINDCIDGVDCLEWMYQENRCIEFRIIWQ